MNIGGFAATRALVAADGRLFTLGTTEYENISPAFGIKHKDDQYLTCRDAFNGMTLWKAPVGVTHNGVALSHLNTAPLVATADRVYLGLMDKIVAYDAATGKELQSFRTKYRPIRLVLAKDLVISASWEGMEAKSVWDNWTPTSDAGAVEAFEAVTGKKMWSIDSSAQQLIVADGNVYLLVQGPNSVKEQKIIAAGVADGKLKWSVPHTAVVQTPSIELGVAGQGILAVVSTKEKMVKVLSAEDGSVLWQLPTILPYAALVKGELWNANRRFDPKTGKVLGGIPWNVNSGGCTPTSIIGDGDYFAGSRGCGYIDLRPSTTSRAIHYGGIRGGCLEGAVPANGMFYAAQNACRCAQGQMPVFVAFGPSDLPKQSDFEAPRPVEKGSAFGQTELAQNGPSWPAFLRDSSRFSATPARLPATMKVLWQTQIAAAPQGPLAVSWKSRLVPCLTAPVWEAGMTYMAAYEEGQVVAVDGDGKEKWRVTLGGRVDGPPTIYEGMCILGCHDGWVYALRAKDGQLAWRTRIAPLVRKMVAYGQVESVWPAAGSVLAADGTIYASAGRTSESDGGVAIVAMEPATGKTLWAKQIPSGNRVNDVLAFRDGKVWWYGGTTSRSTPRTARSRRSNPTTPAGSPTASPA
jgi:outer membrane protein assembly factor BamB